MGTAAHDTAAAKHMYFDTFHNIPARRRRPTANKRSEWLVERRWPHAPACFPINTIWLRFDGSRLSSTGPHDYHEHVTEPMTMPALVPLILWNH